MIVKWQEFDNWQPTKWDVLGHFDEEILRQRKGDFDHTWCNSTFAFQG